MLTETKVKSLKPRAALYRVADKHGLCIEVAPEGGKRWRYRYRFAGKPKMVSLGVWPEVSLEDARDKRQAARKLIREGIDPSAHRKAAKDADVATDAMAADTFKSVADDWLAGQDIAPITKAKNLWILDKFLFPQLGSRPIASISSRELLTVLRKIEKSGMLETAKRARVKAGQIWRYAVVEGKADNDITAALRGALKPPKVKHHAAITDPKQIGELLRAVVGFEGGPATKSALQLAALTFVRSSELRQAEWSEIDLDGAMWRIPGERMKMKAPHLVPLSTQAIAILRDLHQFTGHDRFVFPSVRSAHRVMSENTLNAALRRLGFTKDEMTLHGFRSMAATRLNELGWRADAIERQLAHAESNKVRDAYTSAAQYLDERTKMMQSWADHLDVLRTGGNKVVAIRKARA